jgi:hypothetical protein
MKVIKAFKNNGLTVVIGADDPQELQENKAANMAVKAATKKGYNEAIDVGEVRTYGQNRLAERKFYFKR